MPQLTPGNQLRFVYYMYLNEQAMPINGFKNEANVETDFMTDQTPPSVEVLTGGKRFLKVDGAVTVSKRWQMQFLLYEIKTVMMPTT